MLCVWVHGCDPGRLSDGSRLELYQKTLSRECSSPILFIFLACALWYCSSFFLSFLSCFCVEGTSYNNS